MPIYEYKCTNCGSEEEHLQKISDQPKSTCKQCGKDTLVKTISTGSFNLKGEGFHKGGMN